MKRDMLAFLTTRLALLENTCRIEPMSLADKIRNVEEQSKTRKALWFLQRTVFEYEDYRRTGKIVLSEQAK
jgi:hypothetical protein